MTKHERAVLTFDPPLCCFHLSGGLSALVGANDSAALMPAADGLLLFSLYQKGVLEGLPQSYPAIRMLGSNVFRDVEEMKEPVSAGFSVAPTTSVNYCPADRQSFFWSGMATALHTNGRGSDALIASRVASEVRASCSRLERLSVAYRTVLTQVWTKGKLEPSTNSFTSDKYAAHIGNEYKALLNALYGLRDALLAAAHRLRFNIQQPFNLKALKSLVVAEPNGASRLIFDSMFSPEGDLLIDHMSLYRSISQHCLGSTSPVFGDVYQLRESTGDYGELRYIVYPLYDDIEKMRGIERGASKGILERPPEDEVRRFAALGQYIDALEFCYDCFQRLLQIAELLQREIGIKPEQIVITDDDILEIEFRDKAGKLIRAKRDQATGQLVEY